MAVNKHELPSYFDKGVWRRVPTYTNVSRRDITDPCALCGWGRHMAIHCKPAGEPPAGTMGLHGWVRREPPNAI